MKKRQAPCVILSADYPLKLSPIFSRDQAGLPRKDLPKCTAVFVAHLVGDFVKREPPCFQQPLGSLDANALLVAQRRFPCGGFKAPFQGPPAHPAGVSQMVVGKILIEIFFDPLLNAADPIVMVIFPKEKAGRYHALLELHGKDTGNVKIYVFIP